MELYLLNQEVLSGVSLPSIKAACSHGTTIGRIIHHGLIRWVALILYIIVQTLVGQRSLMDPKLWVLVWLVVCSEKLGSNYNLSKNVIVLPHQLFVILTSI